MLDLLQAIPQPITEQDKITHVQQEYIELKLGRNVYAEGRWDIAIKQEEEQHNSPPSLKRQREEIVGKEAEEEYIKKQKTPQKETGSDSDSDDD